MNGRSAKTGNRGGTAGGGKGRLAKDQAGRPVPGFLGRSGVRTGKYIEDGDAMNEASPKGRPIDLPNQD